MIHTKDTLADGSRCLNDLHLLYLYGCPSQPCLRSLLFKVEVYPAANTILESPSSTAQPHHYPINKGGQRQNKIDQHKNPGNRTENKEHGSSVREVYTGIISLRFAPVLIRKIQDSITGAVITSTELFRFAVRNYWFINS